MIDVKNRSFLGAIAGAIKAICMLIIKGVGTADRAISMADKAVRTAQTKQVIDLAVDMNDYATKARETAVLKQVKQELAMREFIGDDAERKALVDKSRTAIDKVLSDALAELHQTEE
jgi:hypothetical protein